MDRALRGHGGCAHPAPRPPRQPAGATLFGFWGGPGRSLPLEPHEWVLARAIRVSDDRSLLELRGGLRAGWGSRGYWPRSGFLSSGCGFRAGLPRGLPARDFPPPLLLLAGAARAAVRHGQRGGDRGD